MVDRIILWIFDGEQPIAFDWWVFRAMLWFLFICVVILVLFHVLDVLNFLHDRWQKLKPRYAHHNASNISTQQMKMLSVGLILGAWRGEYVNSVAVKKRARGKKQLDTWWKVDDESSALKTLEFLKADGQRRLTDLIVADTHGYDPTSYEDYLKLYDRNVLTESQRKKYPQFEIYLHILEEYPTILVYFADYLPDVEELDAFSEEQLEKKYDIDYSDFSLFMLEIYENLIRLMSYANYLKASLSLLKKEGVITTEADLIQLSPLAWDMGRLVHVARQSYTYGYINEETAWAYIQYAYERCQGVYASWKDFARGYMLGRIMWCGNDDGLFAVIHRLTRDKKSPWVLYPLGSEGVVVMEGNDESRGLNARSNHYTVVRKEKKR
ncbi:MAG: DUF1266 domain-containing protein [Turicibacter sp.]|nr:DUF1266 domain-containing protein [Turicibacter sp.]